MTLETALITAISTLAGVVGVLCVKMNEWMVECRSERAKCEESLREIWEYLKSDK